jgi:NADH-quinone oxidoreductase subunit F
MSEADSDGAQQNETQQNGPLLTPVLTRRWGSPDSWKLSVYEQAGGYAALRKALVGRGAGEGPAHPDQLVQLVKDSGLRGRGGAGFPAGMKWGFMPAGDDKPHYVVVNADESEPGTCKDVPLMMADPHSLIEGAIITSYAVRAHTCFIYVRGEVPHCLRRVRHAVNEAYAAGYVGKNILDSGFDLDIVVHAGAGAYEAGEETALLDSLEGRRAQPRLKPPFPASSGLYGAPTALNNVETIASVPAIVLGGADWFRSMGTEKSPGPKIYSVSGHVERPGQYEAPLGITLRQLLELAGGMKDGIPLKFWTPGGSSTPLLTAEHLDVPLDFESVTEAGSMLGTTAIMVFNETVSVPWAVLRWTEFYEHESCGKCTPCREGCFWMAQVLHRLVERRGTESDIEVLLDVCDNILGRSLCALGDGATSPVTSAIQFFRQEFLDLCTIQPGELTGDQTSRQLKELVGAGASR